MNTGINTEIQLSFNSYKFNEHYPSISTCSMFNKDVLHHVFLYNVSYHLLAVSYSVKIMVIPVHMKLFAPTIIMMYQVFLDVEHIYPLGFFARFHKICLHDWLILMIIMSVCVTHIFVLPFLLWQSNILDYEFQFENKLYT